MKKEFTPLQKECVRLLLYAPEKLRAFIASTTNPKYTYAFLYSLMPYRFGIEIDVTGYYTYIHDLMCSEVRKYRSREYDSGLGRLDVDNILSKQESPDRCSELKYTCFTIRHLASFKKVLEISYANLKVAENGGLHVHVDLGSKINEEAMKLRSDYKTEYLNFIASKIQKYYKYYRNVVFKSKKSYGEIYGGPGAERVRAQERAGISVMRGHNTIEYRLGTPTFEYSTIMRWVLCCELMNKSVRLKQPFNKELCDAILAIE